MDGWRTGVLNSLCFPSCALSFSWKCSAWSCVSTSQTTKIWQAGNHTRLQNNQLAIEIMYVLWLGKGLTGTDFGKRRWSSRNHSNAQHFISASRARAEEGSNFNEGFGFRECDQIMDPETWPNALPDLLWFCPSEYTVGSGVLPRKMAKNSFKMFLSTSFSYPSFLHKTKCISLKHWHFPF